MDEQFLIQLRDCFTAGYTLPQFCVDNGIKKPLFVAEGKFWQFVWEIYVQFRYDKRMQAQFCFLDLASGEINFSVQSVLSPMSFKHISEVNFVDVDAVICLTTKRIFSGGRVIYLAALTDYFIRKTYAEIPSLNFMQCHPGVKLILTNYPTLNLTKNSSAMERQLYQSSIHQIREKLHQASDSKICTPYDSFGYTNQEVYDLLEMTDAKSNSDGTTSLKECKNPRVAVHNGKRFTANQPDTFRNKIFFIGTCTFFGIGAPFDKTVESYLQEMLNENNLPYRVENESQFFAGRYQDIFYNLNKLSTKSGDIIFLCLQDLVPFNIPFFDVRKVFNTLPNHFKIFADFSHVNELGYKILAEKYFVFLTENNFFRDTDFKYPPPSQPVHRYGIPSQYEQGGAQPVVSEKLEAYKQQLRAYKLPVGALVMNCNPFTLGHRYLVEYAAAQVVKLYIFGVEEDKSEFPFVDRIELVRHGVKDLPNVEVLPSGQFIISQTTFSGYFNKAELQDVAVDSSEDVEIFGREIAPTLGITIRFAG